MGLRDQRPPPGSEALLRQVMSGGRRTAPAEPLERARQSRAADLAELSDGQRRLRDPSPPTAGYTAELLRHARDAGAAPPLRMAR